MSTRTRSEDQVLLSLPVDRRIAEVLAAVLETQQAAFQEKALEWSVLGAFERGAASQEVCESAAAKRGLVADNLGRVARALRDALEERS